jgi:hypothetical protein
VPEEKVPNPADDPLDYSKLWYSDPTGNQAVDNLMEGDYTITFPSGATIVIDVASIRPALALYSYTPTRTGKKLRARLKTEAADAWQGTDRGDTRNPHQGERNV